MCKLISPDTKYYKQYKEMMDEWNSAGGRIAPWPLEIEYDTEEKFENLIKRVQDVGKGIDVGEYSPSTTYWLYDDKRDIIIGASNLRHKIVGESGNLWGHIGYGIRPSERKKGYATMILKMTLEEAKKRNIKNVYAGSYTENIGSWKTLEKCGFEFEEKIIDKDCNKEVKKYCYSFRKKFAFDLKVDDTILKIDQKIISVDNDDFTGDVVWHHFIEVAKPIMVSRDVCMMDSGYKWLEFYDYSSKNRLTALYDENEEIIEWYFDISRKIGKIDGNPYEDDLYLDVVVTPQGKQILLDEDEIEEAFSNDSICEKDYKIAYEEANRIMDLTKEKSDKLKKFTDKYLEMFK